MFHSLPKQFLYCGYKAVTQFADDVGTDKVLHGTAFVVAIGSSDLAIVTNRHMVDIDYKQPTSKYKNFKLRSIVISGRRDDDSLYRFSVAPESPASYSANALDDVAVLIRPRCQPLENMPEMKLFYHFGLNDLADDRFLTPS